MSDSKPEESVSVAESTEPESESAPKETVETVSEEAAPSPKVDAAESAQSQADEPKTDEESVKPTPEIDTNTDDVEAENKTTSENPIEPDLTDNTASERKQSSSSEPAAVPERKQSSSSETTAAPERKQSSASDTAAAERKQSSVSETTAAPERKQSSASDTAATEREQSSASETERKQSSVSDTAAAECKQSSVSENIVESEHKQSPTSDTAEQSSASDTAAPERKKSTASDTAISERKQSSASDTTAAPERKKSSASDTASERKQSSVSDKSEPKERRKSTETEANDEIQDMIKEISGPKLGPACSKANSKSQSGKETTENLLSVLEDGIEGQAKEKPSPQPSATTSADSAPPVKPPKPKKYLYKLKSKTGKILHYTSTVPITLKRPIIHLTKMPDTSKSDPVQKVKISERDDVDSDNSTKENNLKENEAPNDNVMRVVRKKGRPPLSSRLAPPVITLDGNASDTSDDLRNKSSTSFSMQTRKRQMKFLPDGRLVTPEKRVRTGDKNQSATSSDSDIDVISDSEKGADSALGDKSVQKKLESSTSTAPSTSSHVPSVVSTHTVASATSLGTTKKFRPDMIKTHNSLNTDKRKYKKVFDYESYYREKSGIPSPSGLVRTPVGNRSFASNLTPIRKITDTPKLKPILPSSAAQPKKTSSVDPAQLLSSLIGVPISSGQLNVVKFKPKIIQERTNTIVASTPKKVTFEDDRNTKYGSSNQSELLKSTPFKIVNKPSYQKILPKPIGADRTPISQSRMAYQPINIDNKFTSTVSSSNSVYITSNTPFLRESLHDTLAKFDSFTDSKVVKTKEGPRKGTKRKLDEDVFLKDNNSKTLYDLMYEIFEKMPSWNLHVVPDTNCFCIAQVSRGRMGIPTLKKSIEINSEFFAKVYVHQLQCKRYDGIYDTESKILKLIKEIDALAA